MPVKRRLVKVHSHRVTQQAVEAYVRRDFHALHTALGLKPWERSPLPINECALGVDGGEPPELKAPSSRSLWRDSWYVARELQAGLEAALRCG